MINPILQKDDKFIRISKYGYTIGIVKEIGNKVVHSADYKCSYFIPTITSTNGIQYELSECFKVRKEYNEQELEDLKQFITNMDKTKDFKSMKEVMEHHKNKKKLDNL